MRRRRLSRRKLESRGEGDQVEGATKSNTDEQKRLGALWEGVEERVGREGERERER